MEKEEKIDKYLNGRLTPEELKAFEDEIASNAELQQEVTQMQAISEGIKDTVRAELLQRMKKLEEEISITKEDTRPVKKGLRRRLYAISTMAVAASILLLIFFWNWNGSGIDAEALYAQHFESYPNYVENIERSDPKEIDLYTPAFFAYEEQDYSTAIAKFEEILRIQPENLEVVFYLGMSYLEDNQLEKAKMRLEKLAPLEHRFAVPARWYLALTQLKLEKTDAARQQLKQLSQGDDKYAEQAKALLKQLP